MNNSITNILDKISDYKKKFYKNQLIKGLLISLALILGLFLFVNFLEFYGRFNTPLRIALLITFIGVSAYTLAQYILKPAFYLLNINKPISNEEAALQIGQFFPNIKDKLLNTIQLAGINTQQNALLEASITQKTEELKFVKFADAININENKKYLKYVIPPIALVLLISAIAPKFFNSTERIVKFNKTFAEPAPFQFEIVNPNLQAIKNEDYTLKLNLLGNSLPEDVYLVTNGRKYKMNVSDDNRAFDYTFSKIQEETDFHFIAGGFNSSSHKIKLVSRPNLLSFNVSLKYPAYLGKRSEDFDNVGNLVVPEGTVIRWTFKTDETENFQMVFDSTETVNVDKGIFSDYNFQKKISKTSAYEILLKNKHSLNADPINYFINVIPDRYPQLNFEQLSDSSLYNYIGIGGTIADDYGISDFQFAYRTRGEKSFKISKIPFNKASLSQTFFYQVDINSLGLQKNDQLEYYLIVTDNDGVNGRKSTKSSVFNYNMPTTEEYTQDVEKEVNKTEDKFEELLKKSKEFKKDLETLENDLKKKKEMDFQDKKDLEQLINKKEELNKELQNLKDQLRDLMDKQNRFEQQSPKTQEKMEMLQKIMDELMKNEDSKILDELKKLMEKQIDEKSLNELDKFNKQQRNLDKDLDRTLNLFKDLQRKQNIENAVKDLRDLAEKQENLSEKAEQNTNESKSEELKREQDKLNKEFNDVSKKLDDIEKQSDELKKDFDKQEDKQQDIANEQKNSSKQLENKKNKDAAKPQKNAAKKMKEMADEMEQQMQSNESQQTEEDMNSLRGIMENLIKISHDQERIMKNFKNISVSDPRFIALSQEQLNISNDSKIIEDSLYSLASRVMQLEAMVTKEVTTMKNRIDESVKLIRERKLPDAASKQQFSMTSMNNLALMLSDVFKQMQKSMSPGPGDGKGNKPGGEGMGEMGEKQKQLNKRIQGIGTGGKSPKETSEEIAKIANEQAQIRKKLQELQNQLNGTEAGKKLGDELEKIQKEMDKSEEDLVNKRVNPTLQRRQKDIETRLLEAEKAIKEQELDPTRKGQTVPKINRPSPPDLEKFKKEKEKQVELLRTTPPNFTPFYKNQTDNYFKRIN